MAEPGGAGAEPDFEALLRNEFPGLPSLDEVRIGRRRFLELMGASFALGGLAACGPAEAPDEAVPYVEMPPGLVPGVPRTFATAVTRGGYADGVLVTHQMGRPVKVEGNPAHPASRGLPTASGRPASWIFTIRTGRRRC